MSVNKCSEPHCMKDRLNDGLCHDCPIRASEAPPEAKDNSWYYPLGVPLESPPAPLQGNLNVNPMLDGHYCPDWDGLWIDKTHKEYQSCTCKRYPYDR